MEEIKFEEFRKIARLNRVITVTEKIDGTNAQIFIEDDGVTMHVGSRTRWLSGAKGQDNHGFFAWVDAHRDEILTLGPGRNYGEWFGQSIQRNYGLKEKRFSLFNTAKWNETNIPPCVSVVPVLYHGPFRMHDIDDCLENLRVMGSCAVPGFMKPEGIVIYHSHANQYFKVTLENDELPKSLVTA